MSNNKIEDWTLEGSKDKGVQYTPGPWIYNGAIITAGDSKLIFDARLPKEFDANAKLIAAAPELLEALQMFMAGTSISKEGKVTINTQGYADAMQFGEAAIKKATE